MSDLISRQAAIDALRYAQHRFTVADEAGGMGTVKWSEDVIYFAAAERVLSELPSAQPEPHDLVSRRAALEAMDTWDKFGCDPDGKLVRYDDDKHYIPYVHYEDMVHVIKHLPSALGNPCIGCADYDPVKDTCKSSGACGDPANKWKGTDCEVKDETD